MKEVAGSLCAYAGGRPALRRLAEAQYRRCLSDPLLTELFGSTPTTRHVDHLADWLTEVLGGPKLYTERHGGHAALLRHHAGRSISTRQRERFVAVFMEAADEVGLPRHPRFRARLREYVEWGATIAEEVSRPGADVSSDQPVPVWDWGPEGPPPD